MDDAAFLTDWSAQAREQHFHQVIQGGWSRIQPPLMTNMLVALAIGEQPLTREQWRAYAAAPGNPDGDWNGSCWDEPQEDDPGGDDRNRAEGAGYAAHFGLSGMESIADAVALMEAAGLVREVADADGVGLMRPVTPFPCAEDAFPLSEQERTIQRELRVESISMGAGALIIDLFDPDGARLPVIKTSLQRLARTIDGTEDDARQAVRLLIKDGDFSATTALADLAGHRVFELRCDWDAFDANRISIRPYERDPH